MTWAATQTRPDVAFDALDLSMILTKAKLDHAKTANKTVKKAKKRNVYLKFSHLGEWKNLHLEVFADAALGNAEKDFETRSVMGYFIAIANDKLEASPLHWKSKVIEKVAEDVKTAETLALETAIDDSIHLSDMIAEIYSGEKDPKTKIPLVINEDSASLIESLYSTKKVKRKTMRVVISSIQQNIKRKRILDIMHVKSKDQLADVFTKSGVHSEKILNVIQRGTLLQKQDQSSIDVTSRNRDMILLNDQNNDFYCDMIKDQKQDQRFQAVTQQVLTTSSKDENFEQQKEEKQKVD